VDAAVDAADPFSAYSSGVYQNTSTSCTGTTPCYYTPTDHAISLVGWNDNPPEGGGGCWILRNSWGSSWGEDGYMRIRYTSARVSCEVCYFVYGQSSPSTALPIVDSGNYDGKFGITDVAVFRSYYGIWSVKDVTRVYFGAAGDIPASGDYDGDKTTDIAVFRPVGGLWAIRNITSVYFGQSADIPVPGDYNGDGTCDAGVFRASTGLWAIRNVTAAYFGASGDTPVPAYYAYPYAKKFIGIFRPSSGLWVIQGLTRFYFGAPGDVPAPGNYDNDGVEEAAVFRASYGLWSIRNTTSVYFGGSGDIPVPGDYSVNTNFGDDIATFRPSNGLWSVRTITSLYFGSAGDIPVTR
jgi:hypothetical protein